jgi:hypothetical protein
MRPLLFKQFQSYISNNFYLQMLLIYMKKVIHTS